MEEHAMEEDVRMTTRPKLGEANTATRILDVAERLVQSRGFNGFSYADIAGELKITKASLHYHFPSKASLGQALIDRYAARFADALTAIDGRVEGAPAKLDAYAELYADVLRRRRMCLCGMLAADYDTLPSAMRDAVIRFFDDNEAWVAAVLEHGQRQGALRVTGSAREAAQAIVGGLEGAALIARPYGDVARFQATAARLVESLASAAPPPDSG
jgi:TetR/AcrR family transcriptional regulator, transcriptional repressor for nem operon